MTTATSSIPSRPRRQQRFRHGLQQAHGCRARRASTVTRRAARLGGGAVFDAVERNERVIAGGLWASLVAAAASFSGAGGVDDVELVKRVVAAGTTYSAGDILAAGGTFFYLFNAMGIIPALYLSLLLPNESSYKGVKAWPFVALSFGLGAFALLPYFVLRTPAGDGRAAEVDAAPSLPQRIANSKINAALLTALSVALLGGAVSTVGGGGWDEYMELYRTNKLAHVTTLDFLTLSLVMPYAARLDAAEKGQGLGLSNLAFVPVVGASLYLLLRPKVDAARQPRL